MLVVFWGICIYECGIERISEFNSFNFVSISIPIVTNSELKNLG